jgi:Fe-S-cluster containining protein
MLISKKIPKETVLKLGKECKMCGNCCKYTSGFLVDDDIIRIARFLRTTTDKLKEKYLEEHERFNTKILRPKLIKGTKPYGKCIFYNEQVGCTIHEVKPLHCRIGNCNTYGDDLNQWFMLNYFVNPDDPESIRQWKIFLTQNKPIPGGSLNELVPDEGKLKKILSYEVLKNENQDR